jgi:hypothetical protein
MAAMTKYRKFSKNIGYISKRGPSKDHLCQVWSKLANDFRGGLKEGDLRTI